MAQAKEGDTVKVHYTGKLEDGTVFDTSEERAPLEFTIGSGQIIPGFERAVVGMEPGEAKTATIPPEEAYGPRRDEMTITVDREQFPEDINPEPGQQLQVQQPDGRAAIVVVSDVSESSVTLDANHPLAGQPLTFDIELVDIISAAQEQVVG
ncbi:MULTISPECIES: FKBP-type peptidyl-prolyl cis-trans isomerase [Methanoculleus]|uniref:Peptidyl-prolyl cis-trans isomerase n=2 Tax=Methanoculleus TaxID=45989 RepID=A3CWE1_METMJ|nr:MULTISPECIES: peptidylprolyl isomerase [Methanoculleus]ABN57691.1 peptidylprolyl isomerase, FKBP-type [Methanoculleus marisnigri JR1]UYU19083.1 peptidylprolyl isomerase [Methanoculleus submarinus]